MADIVRFVTGMFDEVTNASMVDLEKLFVSDSKFSNALVSEVMQWPLQKTNPFHPISKGFSLFSAWEALALSGSKRVPVVDANAQVFDIVTQSMVIDFLWQNIEMIGKVADRKVNEIQPLRHKIMTQVEDTSKAIIAFREMVNRQVDHVAVVNKHGQLVDNLSSRDLRGIRPEVKIFYRLWSFISDFKSKVREEYPEKTPSGLIFVLPTDTLYQVVEIMAVRHVHHVFVVEDAVGLKPIRTITQDDILREVLGK